MNIQQDLHEKLMKRVIALARLGQAQARLNPSVGALIYHPDSQRVLSEGYYRKYGGDHAEVDALKRVKKIHKDLVRKSVLYVSLEPCCIHRKTPPCTKAIIHAGIPKVVIGCLDVNPDISGQGVRLLQEAGVEVITGVLEDEASALVLPHSIRQTLQRPYIILKYAESQDGFIAPETDRQQWLSGPLAKRLVHRWRAEVDAILVGRRTVDIDNPKLTNRFFGDKQPLRITLDASNRLATDRFIFDATAPTLLVNRQARMDLPTHITQLSLPETTPFPWTGLWPYLIQQGVGSVLIEGGAQVLHDLVQRQMWDEARVITSPTLLQTGKTSPELGVKPHSTYSLGADMVRHYYAASVKPFLKPSDNVINLTPA